MPEVSDPLVELAPLLAALACLRVFLHPGRGGWRGRGALDQAVGEAEDLRQLRWHIHDRTMQRLIALGWLAERTLGDQGIPIVDEIEAIQAELRAIVLGAGLGTPHEPGLADALRAFAEEHRGPAVPAIHLLLRDDTTGRPPQIPEHVIEQAFHVAREAIWNALRHGSATEVVVEADLGPDRLRIEVRDNGAGIDPDDLGHAHEHGHAGLREMQERASAVGARVAIVSDRRGTRVTFVWRR